jgi:hypothetical protein
MAIFSIHGLWCALFEIVGGWLFEGLQMNNRCSLALLSWTTALNRFGNFTQDTGAKHTKG